MKKIYKLTDYVWEPGCQGGVFDIENHKRLVCKILHNGDIEELKNEYEIAKILRKNGISVPRYIGICKVEKDGRIYYGLIMQKIWDSHLVKENIPVWWVWRTISDTTTPEYIKGTELLAYEISKIEKILLRLEKQWIILKPKWYRGYDFQCLYSWEKDRVYLIDFWEIVLEMIDK